MNKPFFLPILAPILAAVTGCAALHPPKQDAATTPPQEAPAEAHPAVKEKAPEARNLELTPELFYQLLVAEVALHRGRPDVAVNNYSAVDQAVKAPELAERAARIALYARDDAAALDATKQWVELAPDNVEARQILIALLIRHKEPDAAFEQLEYLLKTADKKDERLMMLANQLGRETDRQAAMGLMQRLVDKHTDDPLMLYVYSQLALNVGDFDVALASIDSALALKPDWTNAMMLRSSVLTMRGAARDAQDYLGEMVKKYPKDDVLRVAYARMLSNGNQYEQALEQFKVVNKHQPDAPDILFAMAMLHLQLKQIDEGEKFLLKLSQHPDHLSEAAFYLGMIAQDFKKDPEVAIGWFGKVDSGNNYLEAQLRKALLLADRGNVDEARAHLHTIEVESPAEKTRVYMVEGEILRGASRFDEAVRVYNTGLAEMPDDLNLLYGRAMIEEKLDQIDLMEKDLRKIIEREPNNAEALNALGYTLADRTDRYQEALGYIERALKLKPDSRFVIDSMGWVQYRLGNNKEALDYLRRALDMNQDPEVAAHLIEVLWATGDKDGARDVYRRALQAAPDKAVIENVMKRLEKAEK